MRCIDRGSVKRSSSNKKSVKPLDLDAGTEPLTPWVRELQRIDVTVTDPMLGLEIGVSLKGLNFKMVFKLR